MVIRTQIRMVHQVLIQIKTKQKHKRTHHQQPKKQIKQKAITFWVMAFFFIIKNLSYYGEVLSIHRMVFIKMLFHFSKQLIKLNKAMVLGWL